MKDEYIYWIIALAGFAYIMTKHKANEQIDERLEHGIDAMNLALSPLGYSFTINRIASHIDAGEAGYDSQHNATKYGKARAVDMGVRLYGQKLNGAQLHDLYLRIRALGIFSGIGIYPNWNTAGVHLDVRDGRSALVPATWSDLGSGTNHVYASIGAVLA